MIRGYLINEFGEKVGCYNINGRNEYTVSMYHNKIGYMTEKQLVNYALNLGLMTEETKMLINKIDKPYGVK